MSAADKALFEREERFVMQTYPRKPVIFERGEGALLFDESGREYIDLLAGISVASVGHSNPQVVAAISEQAGRLMHVSNLFYTRPMVDLAEKLSNSSLGGRVFFCNSGAEANECAIKIARKHAHERGAGEPEIVSFESDFHGRTYGALSATPGLAKDPKLGPMLPGFRSVPFDDATALREATGGNTAAILIEPIQGEAGVFAVSDETLKVAREICDETGALLIFDEIQTGMGRTGSLWAYEQGPVRPDVITSAKALGGGTAIGACITNRATAPVLGVGDHGSTFAAGPVAASAALAVLDQIDRPETLRRVRQLGAILTEKLEKLDGVVEVRGRGLMLGVALAEGIDSAALNADLLERGLVCNAPRPDSLRLLPPFVLTDEQADRAVAIIESALSQAVAG
ncbi:MAG TPA: acetylornithine/succinylornithine family transaminase [Solirubrobacterales bacterium]|nr:acetylornithine/succinylornithine family transaminase [Solirubrobacterales bacterium]